MTSSCSGGGSRAFPKKTMHEVGINSGEDDSPLQGTTNTPRSTLSSMVWEVRGNQRTQRKPKHISSYTATSQLQHHFSLTLRLLSVWRFTYFSCVCVWFSGFFPTSKNQWLGYAKLLLLMSVHDTLWCTGVIGINSKDRHQCVHAPGLSRSSGCWRWMNERMIEWMTERMQISQADKSFTVIK